MSVYVYVSCSNAVSVTFLDNSVRWFQELGSRTPDRVLNQQYDSFLPLENAPSINPRDLLIIKTSR